MRASTVLFAIVGAIAAFVVAPDATPIDRALPLVVVVLALLEQERIAVLLLLPPVVFTDEHTRLLAYGVIVAIALAAAARDSVRFVIGCVLLLRWIPLGDVVLWRELLMLAVALAVFAASRSALLAIVAAVFTPAFPARMVVIPLLVALILAWLPRIRIPAIASALLFLMWPWSGILARAMPAFLRSEPAPEATRPVWIAVRSGESVSIDAPPGARRAIVIASGANASWLGKGTLMGSIDGTPVRIGDIADFGYTRREEFFRSRNCAPARPLDDVKGYGQSAWLHTAGLIDVPLRGNAINVSAAASLPPNARLQIEAVHFE